MKRLLIILILVVPNIVIGQNSQLNKLFEKYSGMDGYTSVHITKYMFELVAKIDTDEDMDEFKDVTKGLDYIKILTVSDERDKNKKGKFIQELKSVLKTPLYKDLMVVKEGKETVVFKVLEVKKKIVELVMTVEGGGEPVLIYMGGDIDLNKISKMSKSFKIDGFEHLKDVKVKRNN